MPPVSLIPLDLQYHVETLQRVYDLTPGYWDMYGLPGAPANQALRDLQAMAAENGRYGMGILQPNEAGNPAAGAQLIGLLDFRLQWPEPNLVYVGMVMVAEPFQRQGVGRTAWAVLEPWLAHEAAISTASGRGTVQSRCAEILPKPGLPPYRRQQPCAIWQTLCAPALYGKTPFVTPLNPRKNRSL